MTRGYGRRLESTSSWGRDSCGILMHCRHQLPARRGPTDVIPAEKPPAMKEVALEDLTICLAPRQQLERATLGNPMLAWETKLIRGDSDDDLHQHPRAKFPLPPGMAGAVGAWDGMCPTWPSRYVPSSTRASP